MLDVHPPHHALHAWRDFFIHIATIVVGLLIAIGLEQTMEYFHHRHQAHRAREQILAELDLNRKRLSEELAQIELHETWLMKDLAIISRLRSRTLRPDDRLRYIRLSERFSDSAWNAARASAVMDYLPQESVVAWERIYKEQSAIDAMSTDIKFDLVKATSVLNSAEGPQHFTASQFRSAEQAFDGAGGVDNSNLENVQSADLMRLTSAQLDELERGIQLALSEDDQLIRWHVDLRSDLNERTPMK